MLARTNITAPLRESPWTAEKEARLRSDWDGGFTATQISARFNGEFSRSAILGKVHRLELGGRQDPKQSLSPEERRLRQRASERMKSLRRRQKWADLTPEAKAEISARQAAYRLMQKALDDAHRSTLGEEPTGFECTLLELNDDRCKYPKGDPGEAGFAFCGAQPRHTSPYCRFHSSLCFLPTQARAPRPYVHSERSA